jgi:intracellular septation protein
MLELLPAFAFLVVNWLAGLFAATATVVLAGLVATVLRRTIDGETPWLAVASVALVFVLLSVGILLEDDCVLKIGPTIGGIAMAIFVTIGPLFRPPLLVRSLGYKARLVPAGWRWLHIVWAAAFLAFAGINEVLRRTLPTDAWVWFAAADGWLIFATIYGGTWIVAWISWDEEANAGFDGAERTAPWE